MGGAGIDYIIGQHLKNVQLLHSMSDVAQI
jgi:hypothetical protein